MKISTKGRYALRVMIDLAMNSNGKYISLKDIATARGNTGGYKLTKQPKEYKVGDILRATEGDLTPIYCLTEDGKCNRQKNCKTYSFWKGLDNVINEYIDSKTLEDLIK